MQQTNNIFLAITAAPISENCFITRNGILGVGLLWRSSYEHVKQKELSEEDIY